MNVTAHTVSTSPPRCRSCNRRLRKAPPIVRARYGRTYGRFADDLFCGKSCAYTWAISTIRAIGPLIESLTGLKL